MSALAKPRPIPDLSSEDSYAEAAAKIDELFRSLVVVRGTTPMPPRDLIPLRMPTVPSGETAEA